MKPYGKKHKKSKRGIYSSDECGCQACNTHAWKVSKSRERQDITNEIQTMYMEGGDFWVACYKPLGISVIGVTEDISIQGVKEAYDTHFTEDN
jgi:arginine deiminase